MDTKIVTHYNTAQELGEEVDLRICITGGEFRVLYRGNCEFTTDKTDILVAFIMAWARTMKGKI